MCDFVLSDGERLVTELRQTEFRKETFAYVFRGIMDSDGEVWTTTQLDEANYNQIYNQYRAKHGIPFPQEIIAMRKYYGLSAAKMSEILGFGSNQYRLYEEGCVPSVSNARVLIAIRNKQTFLEFLMAAKDEIGEKFYAKTFDRVNALPVFDTPKSIPTSFSGYMPFSSERVSATVKFFIREMGEIFVTKMNKLLFYADFLCYKRTGYGITGINYYALPFGPVPDKWSLIYGAIDGVQMNEYVYSDLKSGITLSATDAPNSDVLTEAEMAVLKEIAERYNSVNAGQISARSHNEIGWIDNHKTKGIIDYTYAFDLSIE